MYTVRYIGMLSSATIVALLRILESFQFLFTWIIPIYLHHSSTEIKI